jgi:hypothetical protein
MKQCETPQRFKNYVCSLEMHFYDLMKHFETHETVGNTLKQVKHDRQSYL